MISPVRHVGFIRNVMIGRCGLSAERLLAVARHGGAGNPVSHLATGNLSFDADPGQVDEITGRIELGIEAIIERHEPVFVRTIDQLRATAALDPFAAVALDGVKERCVSYLPSAPTGFGPLPVESPRGDVTIFALTGLEAYSVTRLVKGYATSPGPILEKATGAPVTSRNWNTIEHVLAKHASA